MDELFGDSVYYDGMKKRFQKRYGIQEGLFLTNRVAKLFRKHKFDCVSHVRVALKGNLEQESKYREIASGGCCGFHDSEFTFTDKETGDKKTFKFGLCYGH